ncbi:MAG: TaqI-like C-terminal specificity domain-containing protein [Candidatus Brocadiia bacterium]
MMPPALEELEAALGPQAAHYTPMPIARRMARAVVQPLCRGREPEAILRLRVLDPAVGSGRFLLAALEVLAEATGRPGQMRSRVAERCLFGADVEPAAAALARRAVSEAAGCPPEALAGHIAVADSLLADLPATFGVPGFQAVLANPPWESYSGRHAAPISAARKRALGGRFAAFRRWPSAHGAFLELAARLLVPGGRAAVLVPHQVCHLAGYAAARRAAGAGCAFDPPAQPLGEGCFEGVVQPAAVLFLRRPEGHGAEPTPQLPAGHGPTADVVERMGRFAPAPREAFGDIGVHSGNSARRILHDRPGEGRAAVREGRCIRPFALDPPRRWLEVEPELPPGRYCTIRPLGAYRAARIVLRQTADRPVAARHRAATYFRNSVLACFGVPGLDDRALAGLLNSSLMAFYHRACHADSRQRTFPQVKVAHLRALPLARDAAGLVPLVARLERLAASDAAGAAWREALAALDGAVFDLYGLSAQQRRHVAEATSPFGWRGKAKGRGRG